MNLSERMEQARKAQQEHERRTDVQLEFPETLQPGDVVLVFDARIWKERGYDIGDNSHCWKEATIISIQRYGRDDMASVRFHHDQHVSQGHFLSAMRNLTDDQESATLGE